MYKNRIFIKMDEYAFVFIHDALSPVLRLRLCFRLYVLVNNGERRGTFES